MAESCNDLNVLDRYPLLRDLIATDDSRVKYSVNGGEYTAPYLLTDGIHPRLRCFIQSISSPVTEKEKNVARYQEATRKDVERCFGVLQPRFAILKHPARLHSRGDIARVMRACVILHNMIVTDENVSGVAVPY
jgi:hypothetical protein